MPPAPEACTLRAVLLTGGEPLYLRAELVQGRPRNSVASREPLWWPPVKLAAHHLASFLVSGGESHEPLVDRAR